MAEREMSFLFSKNKQFLDFIGHKTACHSAFIILILFSCVVSVESASKTCTDLPCENGVCKGNTTVVCECFDGWTGPSCSQCKGRVRLTDHQGLITDGAGNYSEDNKCTWLVEPDPPGGPIRLMTHQFATECGWDHLYIFDGDSVFSPLIAAYSGLLSTSSVDMNNTFNEIVAKSGKAYIYFYSDAAYNMTGFRLRYSVGDCERNCSGHGRCDNQTCSCDSDYFGEFCEALKCPNSCSDNGACVSGVCNCNISFKGTDCSISAHEPLWIPEEMLNRPDPRASSASVVIGDELWVLGGYAFGKKIDFTVVYNMTSHRWRAITPASTTNPQFLYGHSVVHYKHCLYMYGGVSGKNLESRMWIYNITENVWTFRQYNSSQAIAGHTATVVGSVMYIIFGHSPVYGYLHTVFSIDLGGDLEMHLVPTTGAQVKGGYGHTSVLHEATGQILVYGGYVSGSSNQYTLSDKLYSFNTTSKIWTILASSGTPRYLHTAVMMNGLMYVFGGNTHNDTSVSFGAKCYSPHFMMYDRDCNSWRYITSKSVTLPEGMSRYGHIAEVYNSGGVSKMLIFGGFFGEMLNDMLYFEAGRCDMYTTNETCLADYEDRICVWLQNDTCTKRDLVSPTDVYQTARTCDPAQGASEYCARETLCGSCLSTAYNCRWCSNTCAASCTANQTATTDLTLCSIINTQSEVCQAQPSCAKCQLYDHCNWDPDRKKCLNTLLDFYNQITKPVTESNETAVAGTIKSNPPKCDTPCYSHGSCENCTSNSCMWCSSQQRCVETNSYVASFLYGQCQDWTTQYRSCAAMRCSSFHTCDECKLNPDCGWCNDESNTGLGKCVTGSARGPVALDNSTGEYQEDYGICPSERWFFIDCPLCQCNGHSTCLNVSSQCDKCMNLTEGDNCQKCIDGYHGNPRNGRNCTACSCNGQADNCDSTTGVCFCRTRGIKGDSCDVCDSSNNYHGNPNNGGTCYYDLKTDYQFTFNLSKHDDRHYTGINFMNVPLSSDRDVDFTVNCSGRAFLNITWKSKAHPQEQYRAKEYSCTYFRTKFEYKDFNFGKDQNVTFFVYIYNFSTPFLLQISFSQFPKIDLVHFFVTFFSCFISLLIIAAVLYKIKHKYDSYRRRQRMIVEMEEMASRPFAMTTLEFDRKTDPGQAEKKDLNPDLRKRKRSTNKPGQITLEPLSNQKAAVLSLFIQLPTGDDEWTPPGHSGLVIGSSLVTLGHQRKQSIEHGKMDKYKHRKQAFTSHDTCV